MKEYATGAFEFPSLNIFCFGQKADVKSIGSFFASHTAGGQQIDINTFLLRFVASGTEAYCESKDLKGKSDAKRFNKYLRSNGVLLSEDKYLDMMFFFNTDEMCKRLDISQSERDEMISEIEATYFAGKEDE